MQTSVALVIGLIIGHIIGWYQRDRLDDERS